MATLSQSVRTFLGKPSARGALFLSLAQVTYSVSSFLLVLALTYLLSKEDFGIYRYIMATFGAVSAFSLTGYVTAIMREAARGTRALRAAIAPVARWSLPAAIVLAGIGTYYLAMENMTLGVALLIGAACAPLTNAWNLGIPYLTGRKAYASTALVSVLNNFIPAVGCIAIAFIIPGVSSVAIAYLVLSLLGAWLGYRLALLVESGNETPEDETLPYAKHLSIMNVLAIIAEQADRLLAFQFLGPAAVATYTIAVAFPEQVKALGTVGLNMLVTKFSRAGVEGDQSLGGRLPFVVMLGGGILASLIYVVLAPLLVRLFFPGYEEAVIYSQAFALSLPAAIATFVPQGWLQAHRRTRRLYQFNVMSSTLQIGAMVAGVWMGGLWGLILARIISRYISLVGALVAQRYSE